MELEFRGLVGDFKRYGQYSFAITQQPRTDTYELYATEGHQQHKYLRQVLESKDYDREAILGGGFFEVRD